MSSFLMSRLMVFVSLSGLLALSCQAHQANITSGTELQGYLSSHFRSQAQVGVERGELLPWYIDGAMMGGEALPVERGLSLDEVALSLSHQNRNGLYAHLQLMSHHDDELTAEHVLLGYQFQPAFSRLPLKLELGRMAGMFSPANPQHMDERLLTDAPLALDLMLGRQFNEAGVRLLWGAQEHWLVGVELWKGDRFPGHRPQSGQGWDLFAQFQQQRGRFSWRLGAWVKYAPAQHRQDDRYNGGHSHGVSNAIVQPYWFSGDTDIVGVHGKLSYDLNAGLRLTLMGEWLQQELSGELLDDTHRAQLEGETEGGWLESQLHFDQHHFGVRYEMLSLANHFSGPGGRPLAVKARLVNQGHEPQRVILGYGFQLLPALQLRVAWIKDDTQDPASPGRAKFTLKDRWQIGVVWRQVIWSDRSNR